MTLPASFLEELRARTPLAALIGRRVRLLRRGAEYVGCCPFHNEKTPSFTVYDDHFHCFGCGAHGDAVAFVIRAEGLEFREAVERLSAEAGLEMPRPTPEAAAAEARRADLAAVLKAAQEAFVRRLHLPEGRAALAYLAARGLTDEVIARFGLGWSGEGRGAIAADLARSAITPAALVEAGLMKEGEGGRPVDLFFGRIMFPIRDARGQTIGFGGRLLGEGQPKYLNGPETAIFSKRRCLYGLDLAREGARAEATIVVVEGYMDAISAHAAGFAGTLALLGTALTAEQLAILWRLSPVPVLCFDGDAAGAGAAGRAALMALPHLEAGRSLAIAALPPGTDPDSLIRNHDGPARFQEVLDNARPLGEAVYDLLREGTDQSTPEGRAAFRARLEEAVRRIPNRGLAGEYRNALFERFFSSRRRVIPRPSTPRLPRPMATPESTLRERARLLCAILLAHPKLIGAVEEAFAALDLPDPYNVLRGALLSTPPALDREGIVNHLNDLGFAAVVAQALKGEPLPAWARSEAALAEAETVWWHIYGLISRSRLEEQVAAAGRDFAARPDLASQERLVALAREALARGEDPLTGSVPSA